MKSWRFKSRINKIGTIIFDIGLIGLILMSIIGSFTIHWTFGIVTILVWITVIGLFLAEQ